MSEATPRNQPLRPIEAISKPEMKDQRRDALYTYMEKLVPGTVEAIAMNDLILRERAWAHIYAPSRDPDRNRQWSDSARRIEDRINDRCGSLVRYAIEYSDADDALVATFDEWYEFRYPETSSADWVSKDFAKVTFYNDMCHKLQGIFSRKPLTPPVPLS